VFEHALRAGERAQALHSLCRGRARRSRHIRGCRSRTEVCIRVGQTI